MPKVTYHCTKIYQFSLRLANITWWLTDDSTDWLIIRISKLRLLLVLLFCAFRRLKEDMNEQTCDWNALITLDLVKWTWQVWHWEPVWEGKIPWRKRRKSGASKIGKNVNVATNLSFLPKKCWTQHRMCNASLTKNWVLESMRYFGEKSTQRHSSGIETMRVRRVVIIAALPRTTQRKGFFWGKCSTSRKKIKEEKCNSLWI